MKRFKRARNKRGSVLVESVISIALMVPLTVVTILVALEGSRAFIISEGMTEAAVLACRALSYEYRTNRSIVTDTTAQQSIFSNIRIANLLHSNSQLEIAAWNLTQNPKTVTVRATYLPGIGTPELSKFPSTGTLNLGTAFKVSQAVTYRIQE